MNVTESSGNVFADLGLPNPEQLLQKSKLVLAISDAITARNLTESDAAKLLGVSQPDLSKMLRGRTMSVTIGRLLSMLNELGIDVELMVRAHSATVDHRGVFRVLTLE